MYDDLIQHKLLVSGVDTNWRAIHSGLSCVMFHCIRTLINTAINDSYKENIAYCDGSCLGNGQKDAVAGIGVYWSPDSQ